MISIRRARHEDADDIILVHTRSVREICSKDYSSSQIEAWAGRKVKAEHWRDAIDRDIIWVVEVHNRVHGFGHLALMDQELGEVLGLYFTPELIGRGAGSELMGLIKKEASANGLRRLRLYSTLTAKAFYQRHGFYQYESDSSIEMRGIAIPCHPMECLLELS